MKKLLIFMMMLVLLLSHCVKKRQEVKQVEKIQPEQHLNTMRADLTGAFKVRRDSLLNYFAEKRSGSYIEIAASLNRGKNIDWALSKLDTLLKDPRGDMFWMYPFITVTYAGRENLPDSVKKKMRGLWKTYHPYRGDTENHFAMYYTALYLITQMYPGEPASSWYNGRSSEENHIEARDYLISWMDITTTIGQGEFDSPDYYGVYIIPMAQLYAYAKDPAMKQRARMMLDYLVADFAVENLNGHYLGGHSRTYPEQVLNQWKTSAAGISWLLFGNTPYQPRGEAAVLALCGYKPSEILYHIATDRSQPYVHKEYKRTRHRIRHSKLRNAPVYKYTYMCKDYGIGSLSGGLLQPIQQHTWDVTWAIDDPSLGFNTLFTVHPYSSGYELAMYFPEEEKLMTKAVMKHKNTYDTPDKWTSASPYEQIFQYRDALIALYNIPENTRFPRICGFFPKTLSKKEEDKSGWIFCQGGNAYIAYYPLAEYKWIEEEKNFRLLSENLKNGAVVQVAPVSDFQSFNSFKKEILSRNIRTELEPTPHVLYTTLQDSVLEFSYGNVPTVNNNPVDYDGWKLYDGPFLHAEKNSKKLEINYKNLHRVLDFNKLSIKEWVTD